MYNQYLQQQFEFNKPSLLFITADNKITNFPCACCILSAHGLCLRFLNTSHNGSRHVIMMYSISQYSHIQHIYMVNILLNYVIKDLHSITHMKTPLKAKRN